MTEVEDLINKTLNYGQANGLHSFVNNINELIVIPKINAYIKLKYVKTELEFKCEVLNWLSFYVAPNHWYRYWSLRMMKYINYILNTNFTKEDFEIIYRILGNALHEDLTIKFIESNYDMGVLIQWYEEHYENLQMIKNWA